MKLTPTPAGIEICPGPAGGKEWPHGAYSPATGLLYTPTVDACGTFKLIPGEFPRGLPYWGGEATVSPEQVKDKGVRSNDRLRGLELERTSSNGVFPARHQGGATFRR